MGLRSAHHRADGHNHHVAAVEMEGRQEKGKRGATLAVLIMLKTVDACQPLQDSGWDAVMARAYTDFPINCVLGSCVMHVG